jgi:hypothetical protein
MRRRRRRRTTRSRRREKHSVNRKEFLKSSLKSSLWRVRYMALKQGATISHTSHCMKRTADGEAPKF